MELKKSQWLNGLAPYKPGRSEESLREALGLEEIVKLGSNESPFGPSDEVLSAIARAAVVANRYPDLASLTKAIAQAEKTAAEEVVLGTGSIDVLDQIFRTFSPPGANVVLSSHAYFAYALLARKASLRLSTVRSDAHFGHDVEGLARRCDNETSLLVLDDPTNMSGAHLGRNALAHLLRDVPAHIVVIVDQAYVDFAPADSTLSVTEVLAARENVIVTKTFSKLHCLAGLRIGYGIARAPLADLLRRGQQAFPVSNIGACAAKASLAQEERLHAVRDAIVAGRSVLSTALNEAGIEVYPSATNFVLLKLGPRTKALHDALLQKGFITRTMDAYDDRDHLRISVGTHEQITAFVSCLRGLAAIRGG